MSNRKLIRPSIKEVYENQGRQKIVSHTSVAKSTGSKNQMPSTGVARRKQIPSEQTNSELFYYIKQMQGKTPMVIILQDGEQIRGVIEWYDRYALKVNRHREPNLMILKHNIKYMFKQEEENRSHRRRKKTEVQED
jgi:sRNA-binding regulator protein Hfq